MNLPEHFLDNFKELMEPGEFSAFLKSFEEGTWDGIRYNSLKLSEQEFLERIGMSEAVPWCPTGFYHDRVEGADRLSIHPWYHAGLYYFQEPSAMFPAEVLDPKPGDRVLDLCAAPGGKTTQLAMKMQGLGLLVANEISPKRVRALQKNMELYGFTNTLVTNSTGKHLLETYGTYFDKVLIDAPCSGEGTFRKDKRAIREYANFSGDKLQEIQRDILDYGIRLLKEGGTLVYSTCTFNPRENEENIDYLLRNYDCNLLKVEKHHGMAGGRPEWTASGNPELAGAVRFWPQNCRGEGHFVAHIRKNGGDTVKPVVKPDKWLPAGRIDESVQEFFAANLDLELEGWYTVREGIFYLMPEAFPYSWKNRISHMGRCLGELTRYGFVPSQSLVMTLKSGQLKNRLELDLEGANRYIKGETLNIDAADGFYGVVFDGQPLGWAKISNGFFKNLYDKKWRKSY